MISRAIVFIFGLAGGVSLSQFPAYIDQYTQRIGGAVDELRHVVADFDRDAENAGLTRQQALEKYEQSDGFLAARGQSISKTINRYQNLETQYRTLTLAHPAGRLIAFARGRDTEIAQQAWQDFKPAVPVTSTGLFHALAGFLAAGLLGLGLMRGGKRLARGREKNHNKKEKYS